MRCWDYSRLIRDVIDEDKPADWADLSYLAPVLRAKLSIVGLAAFADPKLRGSESTSLRPQLDLMTMDHADSKRTGGIP